MEPLLISRREASQVLSISLRSLDTLIREKQIPVVRVRRRVMFRPSDLQKFAARGTEAGRRPSDGAH